MRDGRFRQDLYYRLKVVEVMLPPMRDRVEDVPALVGRFVSLLAERLKRSPVEVSDAAMAALARHDWPGNVRELRNTILRAVLLTDGDTIEPTDLELSEHAFPTSNSIASRVRKEPFVHNTPLKGIGVRGYIYIYIYICI